MTAKERDYLRDLAKKQQELSQLPIMEERKQLWYLHNECKGLRPVVVMEENGFMSEFMPALQCSDEDAKRIERQLLHTILTQQLIPDDKVVTDDFKVGTLVHNKLFNLELKMHHASEGIGYHIEPVLENLEEDMKKLGPSIFSYNRLETQRRLELTNEILGDILSVKLENQVNYWAFPITLKVVEMMGMENMFCSMVSEEDAFHRLMEKTTEEFIRFLRWQEEEGVLFLNNGNDYMGSGSFCFSKELPGEDYQGKVLSRHVWGHINSQESVGISPDMYHEFIAPYCARIAAEFGLLYYGCCEPVDPYWEDISKYPNLRKVSISHWCNEEIMADRLSGSKVIYSRKPSPNFLGVKADFEEEAFRKYIRHTVNLTKECHTEFIFRDIYALHGNLEKVKRAIEIVREEIE